jgi:predicted nucleic-acid-binding protein
MLGKTILQTNLKTMIRVDTNYIIRYLILEIFQSKNLDFVDCLLCAYSYRDKVVTFDKKLNNCINNLKK